MKKRGAQVIPLTRPSLDLSSMASVRAAARELNRNVAHIDVLLNIAAVFTTHYRKSADGWETMFATNHLGPFLLTNLLLDELKAAGEARVINVTAPSTTKLDFDDLQGEKYLRYVPNALRPDSIRPKNSAMAVATKGP